MNKGFILMDGLIILVITMTLAMCTYSLKDLELRYHDAKLEFENNEKLRVKEIEEMNKCQIEKAFF